VRKQLFGHKEAVYSGYTCYTGIADFVPADIETVGYVDHCSCTVYLFILSWEAYLHLFFWKIPSILGTQTILCIFRCWCWKDAMVRISQRTSRWCWWPQRYAFSIFDTC